MLKLFQWIIACLCPPKNPSRRREWPTYIAVVFFCHHNRWPQILWLRWHLFISPWFCRSGVQARKERFGSLFPEIKVLGWAGLLGGCSEGESFLSLMQTVGRIQFSSGTEVAVSWLSVPVHVPCLMVFSVFEASCRESLLCLIPLTPQTSLTSLVSDSEPSFKEHMGLGQAHQDSLL